MLLQYTSYIVKNAKVCCCRWRTLKRNSKLPCLPRNSQPFMTPLIIRMTLHPLQCKCQVSTIAFQLWSLYQYFFLNIQNSRVITQCRSYVERLRRSVHIFLLVSP